MLEHSYRSDEQRLKLSEIEQSAGKLKALAYIIGVYLGDGSVYYTKCNRGYHFELSSIDKDFVDAISLALETLLEKKPRRFEREKEKPRQKVYRVIINSKWLFYFLQEITFKKNIIPQFIKNSKSKEVQLTFFQGIMDSEGWFSKCKRPNGQIVYQLGVACGEGFMTELPEFLQKLGVQCGKLNKMKKPSEKHLTMLRLLLNKISWIKNDCHFSIQRKEDKVQEFINSLTVWKHLLTPQRLHV